MSEESDAANRYQYLPLESKETLRVLIVHPAQEQTDPIKCQIVHVDRSRVWVKHDESLAFEAISYTWGLPDFSRTILCDNDKSTITITPNVDGLLRAIRHPTKSRRVWIDAICLNQGDSGEKAIQVALMADIYRQARKVRIWLGDADDTIPPVWSFIKVIAGREGLSTEEIQRILHEVVGVNGAEHLLKFINLPWFTRRWVIQEAAVSHARNFQCGKYKMSWDCMVDALQTILTLGTPNPLLNGAIITGGIQNSITIRKKLPSLLDQLWEFHTAECSDKRDRIFALLSLTKKPQNELPKTADYSQSENFSQNKSLTSGAVHPVVSYDKNWNDVYQEFGETCVENQLGGEILKHLLHFGSLREQDPKFPSWVPDWSQCRYIDVNSSPVLHSSKSESQEPKPEEPILELGKVLNGCRIITIRNCSKLGSIESIFSFDDIKSESEVHQQLEELIQPREAYLGHLSGSLTGAGRNNMRSLYNSIRADRRRQGWFKELEDGLEEYLQFGAIRADQHGFSWAYGLGIARLTIQDIIMTALYERASKRMTSGISFQSGEPNPSLDKGFTAYKDLVQALENLYGRGCKSLHLFTTSGNWIGMSQFKMQKDDIIITKKGYSYYSRDERWMKCLVLRPDEDMEAYMERAHSIKVRDPFYFNVGYCYVKADRSTEVMDVGEIYVIQRNISFVKTHIFKFKHWFSRNFTAVNLPVLCQVQ